MYLSVLKLNLVWEWRVCVRLNTLPTSARLYPKIWLFIHQSQRDNCSRYINVKRSPGLNFLSMWCSTLSLYLFGCFGLFVFSFLSLLNFVISLFSLFSPPLSLHLCLSLSLSVSLSQSLSLSLSISHSLSLSLSYSLWKKVSIWFTPPPPLKDFECNILVSSKLFICSYNSFVPIYSFELE